MWHELTLKAMSISGTHVFTLLGFSLHHHDEEDSAFVPAADPAHPPIINRLAKPKELGLNVHPHTSKAPLGRTVNSAFGESPERNRTLKVGWAAQCKAAS